MFMVSRQRDGCNEGPAKDTLKAHLPEKKKKNENCELIIRNKKTLQRDNYERGGK